MGWTKKKQKHNKIKQHQDINLFRGILVSPRVALNRAKKKQRNVIVSMVIVSVLAVSALIGTMVFQEQRLLEQINLVQQQIDDPDLQLQAQITEDITTQYQWYESKNQQMTQMIQSHALWPVLDASIFKTVTVNLPSDVGIQQLIYENGQLEIHGQTIQRLSPSIYARNLDVSGQFDKVGYYGFALDRQINAYKFQVNCQLKGGEVLETQ